MQLVSLKQLKAHVQLPLYRNGYALMFSSAATSGLGVLYWTVAAHSYPADVVGLNSAIISAMLLIAGIAQLSLVSVMTRFLPRAGGASRRLVLVAYLLTLVAAALAGLVFVAGLGWWAPQLAVLGATPLHTLGFVLAAMAWCIFTIQDSVLTGLRRTIWVPIENIVYALAKIGLLLPLAWAALPFGIVASWVVPGVVVLLPINYLIFRRFIPQHGIASQPDAPFSPRHILRYAAGNYLGSLLSLAVNTMLPLLVLGQLGASANAYFAQPWLIAGSLQLVAGNMSMSLTVEAASDREQLGSYTRRTLGHAARLLLVAVALIVVAAPYILRIFGPAYAAEGTDLLRLLALGALPNLVVMLAIGVARVQDRTGEVLAVQAWLCGLTLGLSQIWLPYFGIAGVGWAWLLAQSLVALVLWLVRLRPVVAAG